MGGLGEDAAELVADVRVEMDLGDGGNNLVPWSVNVVQDDCCGGRCGWTYLQHPMRGLMGAQLRLRGVGWISSWWMRWMGTGKR